MKIIISNKELAEKIRKAVAGDNKAKFELILIFENIINEKAKINGCFSQECKDLIEDKIFDYIEKFGKRKKFLK